MGQSTDGLLFYGFCPTDEDGKIEDEGWVAPWDEIEDVDSWEDYFAYKKGWKDTSGYFTPEGEYAFEKGTTESFEAEKKWREDREKKSDILKIPTCEVNSHCHGECPMPYICVKESHTSASRGYPETIDAKVMTDPDKLAEWDQELKAFCDFMDIKFEQPKWMLASMWW
ncbi:hypothetical protein N9948_00735 [bacterium]|nr:hypothetical protein [bacterium]